MDPESDLLELASKCLILFDNYIFTSPSSAATILIGGDANGWSEWIDADGKTLDEVYRGKIDAKHKSKREQAMPEGHIFYCKRAESDAQGYLRESGEFVMLAGSILRNGVCAGSKPNLIQSREAFIAAFCTRSEKGIVLNEDYTFPSPSAAALICIGGNANGWLEWIDIDGKTLDEVYRKK